MELHALVDGLAWLTTALAVVVLQRYCRPLFPPTGPRSVAYVTALVVGGTLGAYGLGSLNLWLAGKTGLARSIEGALAGAILAVELYKWRRGLTGRTAALYALPVALGIAVGRIGCFLSGMDDFTYGVPTTLPWGHDFGDGVLRHPVQLYESGVMLAFAALYVIALLRRAQPVIDNGFALFVLVYATSRFGLETLKPYPAIAVGLTVFQIVCLAMVAYALVMIRSRRVPDARPA